MRVNVRGTAEGARVEIIQPGTDGTDQVIQSVDVTEGNELLLNLPSITEPAGVEYGNVVSASGEPAAPPEGEGPTGAEGEGGGAPAGGETPAEIPTPPPVVDNPPIPPTTSVVCELPLYLIEGGELIPEGFGPSGLETPGGESLYVFGGDVAGGPTTGNRDGISVYAESTDNGQLVALAATTSA